MIAIQSIINVLCETFEMLCGERNIYCDNMDALNKNAPELSRILYPRFFRPNVDLKHLLWNLRKGRPPKLELSFNHIKGHQDRNADFDLNTAPKPVHLNIAMDTRSRQFPQQHQGKLEPKQIPLPLTTQKLHLYVYYQHSSPMTSNTTSISISSHLKWNPECP